MERECFGNCPRLEKLYKKINEYQLGPDNPISAEILKSYMKSTLKCPGPIQQTVPLGKALRRQGSLPITQVFCGLDLQTTN